MNEYLIAVLKVEKAPACRKIYNKRLSKYKHELKKNQ